MRCSCTRSSVASRHSESRFIPFCFFFFFFALGLRQISAARWERLSPGTPAQNSGFGPPACSLSQVWGRAGQGSRGSCRPRHRVINSAMQRRSHVAAHRSSSEGPCELRSAQMLELQKQKQSERKKHRFPEKRRVGRVKTHTNTHSHSHTHTPLYVKCYSGCK